MATSIAAASGDLVTIILIGNLAKLVNFMDPKLSYTLACSITILFILVFVVLMYFLVIDTDNWNRMKNSILPVILATLISLFSGFIFEDANSLYKQITLISPMFSGFAGNSISIISSLLSTHTHTFNALSEDKKHPISWTVSCKEVFVHYGSFF